MVGRLPSRQMGQRLPLDLQKMMTMVQTVAMSGSFISVEHSSQAQTEAKEGLGLNLASSDPRPTHSLFSFHCASRVPNS